MDRAYSVEGKWPFPQDMLRHDGAKAATPKNQDLINRMVGESSDPVIRMEKVRIELVMYGGEKTRFQPHGRWKPNAARWESFSWRVVGEPFIEQDSRIRERIRAEDALRKSALAKLTDEERRVLGI